MVLTGEFGHTVVVPNTDFRYQNRLFSRVWLESKGLLEHIPQDLHKYVVLP